LDSTKLLLLAGLTSNYWNRSAVLGLASDTNFGWPACTSALVQLSRQIFTVSLVPALVWEGNGLGISTNSAAEAWAAAKTNAEASWYSSDYFYELWPGVPFAGTSGAVNEYTNEDSSVYWIAAADAVRSSGAAVSVDRLTHGCPTGIAAVVSVWIGSTNFVPYLGSVAYDAQGDGLTVDSTNRYLERFSITLPAGVIATNISIGQTNFPTWCPMPAINSSTGLGYKARSGAARLIISNQFRFR
jgi:hypothetical protein